VHPPQELPPTEEVTPESSFDRQANRERMRFDGWLQVGQVASTLDWLIERNNSNFALQVVQ